VLTLSRMVDECKPLIMGHEAAAAATKRHASSAAAAPATHVVALSTLI